MAPPLLAAKAGMSFLQSKAFLYIIIVTLIIVITMMVILKKKCSDDKSFIYKIRHKWWAWIPPLTFAKLTLMLTCTGCPECNKCEKEEEEEEAE